MVWREEWAAMGAWALAWVALATEEEAVAVAAATAAPVTVVAAAAVKATTAVAATGTALHMQAKYEDHDEIRPAERKPCKGDTACVMAVTFYAIGHAGVSQ